MAKKILITPLSWGIGHATRCIPIIKELLSLNHTLIIASDGDALKLLQKEFPNLEFITLPAYNIKYSKKSFFLPFYLFLQVPRLLNVIKKEKKKIKAIVTERQIDIILNDNRFGCYHKDIKTIYITHQINVLSGVFSFLTTKIHQNIIKKMDICWVPDTTNSKLTGKLSTSDLTNVYFTGILSRFKKPRILPKKKYAILVLLSGIETQRVALEKKLLKELAPLNKKILFVRGVLSDKGKIKNTKHITFVNYLLESELQDAILQSDVVIARSGYSTIMDLAVLQKKCFFIPTPNQKEQEYLAKRMEKLQIAAYCKQRFFTLQKLEKITDYKGFTTFEVKSNLQKLILDQL
ncbi:MAG TPA: glycosyltransferase [Flavobacteriia bacterium]|nr:glycosyltransferase [Flavobacteriia bacterium]